MSNVQVSRLQTLTGHRDCVYTLAKSNEPHRFFSGAGDGMVVMWDLNNPESGELIAKLPNSIYALHYHSENDLLIAGHNYDGIHLLDWKNKKEIASLQLTKAAIFDIQSFNDHLFVATGEGVVWKIDLKRLNIVGQTQPSEKSARTISIHRKRREIAVGYSDHTIRIFDLDDLKLKKEWQAHTNSVFTVRYSPDRNFLFSGSRDARFKVWDVKADYSKAGEVVAHLFAINHLDFSPDGKHFVTCSMDKSIKVWSTEELKLLKVIDKSRHAGHGTSVNKVLWTSHHDQLLSASDDRTISTWNIIF
jgi:WD40 repeat protein